MGLKELGNYFNQIHSEEDSMLNTWVEEYNAIDGSRHSQYHYEVDIHYKSELIKVLNLMGVESYGPVSYTHLTLPTKA